MKVGSTLLEQLRQRMLQTIENEMRLESLLLGEPYEEHQSILKQLVPPRPRTAFRGIDPALDAARYAMMYGTSVHQAVVRPQDEQISGAKANLAVFDKISSKDIEELAKKLYANAMTQGRAIGKSRALAAAYGGNDSFIQEVWKQHSTPKAWPASHKGKQGPAPRKPFRNR